MKLRFISIALVFAILGSFIVMPLSAAAAAVPTTAQDAIGDSMDGVLDQDDPSGGLIGDLLRTIFDLFNIEDPLDFLFDFLNRIFGPAE